MEPAKSVLGVKAKVRQRIRDEGVPYTIVCGALAANWYFLPRIGQAEASGPPTDKVYILGDGNTKGITTYYAYSISLSNSSINFNLENHQVLDPLV